MYTVIIWHCSWNSGKESLHTLSIVRMFGFYLHVVESPNAESTYMRAKYTWVWKSRGSIGIKTFFLSREALKAWAITSQGSGIQTKSFSNGMVIPWNLKLCSQLGRFEFLMTVGKTGKKRSSYKWGQWALMGTRRTHIDREQPRVFLVLLDPRMKATRPKSS